MLAFFVKFRAAVFVDHISRLLTLNVVQGSSKQNEVSNLILYCLIAEES